MSSAAQLAANRSNSQLSTGPRTPEGKQASSQNARRHGFTAMRLSVAPEDQADFNSLKAELLHDVRPEGAIENGLFERLLLAHWNLRRISRYEAELLDKSNPFDSDNPAAASAFDRLTRYRRDLERSSARALKELRLLQTQRAVLLQQHESIAAPFYASTPLAELTRLTGDTDPLVFSNRSRRNHDTFHKTRPAAVEAHHRDLARIEANRKARLSA